MPKEDFLLCYDISDKKRLTQIAKIIEKEALRIQRSVYFYEQVSQQELDLLLHKVLAILDISSDRFEVYTIKNKGVSLGSAIDLENPFIFS
jgi:CRISPR-associated protein Cas2